MMTSTRLNTLGFQHSHSIQLFTQYIGYGEIFKALVLPWVAVCILEDKHSSSLVEDVFGG